MAKTRRFAPPSRDEGGANAFGGGRKKLGRGAGVDELLRGVGCSKST